ncbi:hypothetical protein [Psychrobacter celer]|uniref:hypothetical protein n=1 Tax=Psychrobacter celer TaxID=306572 RepID=UPI003FCEFAC8
MKDTSTDRFFVKSLALVSLLSLAQLTLTAAPIGSGAKLAHAAKKQIGVLRPFDATKNHPSSTVLILE